MTDQLHGGRAVTGALKALGVDHLFTLTGGHIFPILDGAHQDGIRIVDTRHEQSAAFAAEGWSRITRSLGVCAVTAGPGVTNALSPLAQAGFNGAPVLCLAGRAPGFRWGQGSLQEIDHVPFVEPLAAAQTVTSTGDVARQVFAAAQSATTPPRGPRFLDFPLEVLFNDAGDLDLEPPPAPAPPQPDPPAVGAVAALLRAAERPVVIAGSNVWLDRAEGALRDLVEAAELPAFTNGQGRGCLPADHRLCFSRSRSRAFKEADLVLVAGTSMDFRLGFGQGFAPGAKVVHLDSHPDSIARHVDLAASIGAPLDASLAAIASELDRAPDTKAWVEALRETEQAKRDAAQADLRSPSNPIHPLRVYGELVPLLDRDAVVICDGGDFASFAGREVPSYQPGCWLDTGPFGCLGVGPGYAMAARLAHPDRQVVVMYGDGAFGFSGMELETLVRLKLPVVCVIGNNGIWALEKYPMQALYGYDVAAELRPSIRYDRVMEAFGGRGFFVEDPDDLAPALKAAFDSGEPSVVNVVTDPSVAYPRSSNLA
ncbi:MAG TPA: acetolactate synthase [Actinomycetota bacterium]|nr:acetolactate synthase [Actinomycetota bacterium]